MSPPLRAGGQGVPRVPLGSGDAAQPARAWAATGESQPKLPHPVRSLDAAGGKYFHTAALGGIGIRRDFILSYRNRHAYAARDLPAARRPGPPQPPLQPANAVDDAVHVLLSRPDVPPVAVRGA